MKVRCKVCDNELNGFCKIKKITVKTNKSRKCEAYIFNEGKVKAKQEIETVRVSYREMEAAKKRHKEEMKQLRKMMKEGPQEGTAKQLGLVKPEESRIIKPGDPGFSMPNATSAHPLTGDLSRFTTTVTEKE